MVWWHLPDEKNIQPDSSKYCQQCRQITMVKLPMQTKRHSVINATMSLGSFMRDFVSLGGWCPWEDNGILPLQYGYVIWRWDGISSANAKYFVFESHALSSSSDYSISTLIRIFTSLEDVFNAFNDYATDNKDPHLWRVSKIYVQVWLLLVWADIAMTLVAHLRSEAIRL